MRREILRRFEKIVFVLEMIIVLFLVLGIIIGMTGVIFYFQNLFSAGESTYEMFEAFLAYALILIVGIELILMILYHSTRSILELILFVIARKMLVYSYTMEDLVLGTIAIFLVFVILRYLVPMDKKNDIVRKTEHRYLPYIKMKDIYPSWEEENPLESEMTIGDFVHTQSNKMGVKVIVGTKVTHNGNWIEVTKLTDQNQISQLTVYDH